MASLTFLVEGSQMVMKESFFEREILALLQFLGDLGMMGLRYFLETIGKILVPI